VIRAALVVEADRSLVRAVTPAPGHGLYAAFLQACNVGDDPIAASASFRLRDAFGTDYVPVRDGLDPALSFTLGHIGSSGCSPREGSAAERTFDGAALVFDLPYDITQNRPLLLEIRAAGTETGSARIELDV
jgi:hypothetical protein